MIEADRIHIARRAPIETVAERRGLRLIGKRAESTGPCPVCGGLDRFSINTRKQIFFCRGCGIGGDVIALERHVAGSTFAEAIDSLLGTSHEASSHRQQSRAAEPKNASRRPSLTDDEASRTAAALALWNVAADPRGTLAEKYLNSRWLELDDDIAGAVIRWNAGIRAMLALFRAVVTDEPRAVSRTYLDKDARKIERKFLGSVGGCAIKLDADDTVLGGLHIGEGVETCLAARQLGLRPTWALGSAGAIASFPILNGVESLTLLQERDQASKQAVESCARRWHDAEKDVVINEPIGGKDLNDAIRRGT
jgi:hypothetical protein